MNIVIITYDHVAILDGFYRKFDSDMDTPVSKVKWNGTEGMVDFLEIGKQAEKIINFTPYQPLLDIVLADYAAQDIIIAAQKVIDDEKQLVIDLHNETFALTGALPINQRRLKHPTAVAQLEALYEARNGDSTLLDAIDLEIKAINDSMPL